MNIRKAILWRVYFAFFLFTVFGLVIILKIIRIQGVEGAYWRAKADSLTSRYVNIEPIRGNIYSEDGSLLVTSLPVYEARMDFRADGLDKATFLSQVDSLAWCLAHYFQDQSVQEWQDDLLNAWNEGQRYYLIKKDITHQQIKKIREFPIFRLGRFGGGFIVEQKSQRMKPFKELAQRTLGYKRPGVMPVGLEGAYDDYLSGVSGKRLMQKVAGGAWIPVNADNELEPENGMDIISTIHVDVQDIAESALKAGLERHQAHHGCALVMEVATGEIKAIANLGLGRQDSGYYEKYNYAIGEGTEPGSTFKLASVIALLESGRFSLEDSVDTEDGKVWYYDRVMRDDKGGLGYLNLHDAFRYSSNVAISKAVNNTFQDDPQAFVDALRKLRLHQPLGIPIAGEGTPLIKTPGMKDWSGTTLPWMSIGYELRLTPLQILTLYNAIANDGYWIKPRFATEVRQVGRVLERFPPQKSNKPICSPSTLQAARDMMQAVVDSGTARRIRSDRFSIAGKTGTALVATDDGYGKDKVYQASFAGYFPAERPRYSCMVVVNHPQRGGIYGSQVAAPIFKDIAEQLYANSFDMHEGIRLAKEPATKPAPDTTAPLARKDLIAWSLIMGWDLDHSNETRLQDPTASWASLCLDESGVAIQQHAFSGNRVPDVRGMALADAFYVLENHGLRVIFYGSGSVRKQSLKPGERIVGHPIIQLELE